MDSLLTRLRPTDISAAGQFGQNMLALHYNYSANGNVQSETISRSTGLLGLLTQTYDYDGVNRLTVGSESGGANEWSQVFGYDRWGNRSLVPSYKSVNSYNPYTGLTPQVATPAGWQLGQDLTSSTPFNPFNNRLNGPIYDAAGNQTSALGTTNDSAIYDAENRLSTITEPTSLVQFAYDGDGKRVQKVVCPAGTANCTAQTANAQITTYVYDSLGGLAAEYSTAPNSVAGTQYLFADALGSTRLITDNTGNSPRCLDYSPFGLELPIGIGGRGDCYTQPGGVQGYPAGAADVATNKFTGKERDAETGLDYFGARYMSSAMGRWTSPDWSSAPEPIPYADLNHPQTLNLYAYVSNNPLNRSDADGHADCGGETNKSILFCIGNALGLNQTETQLQQQADAARAALSQYRGFTINGQAPADIAKNGTNRQVIAANRTAINFLVRQLEQSLTPSGREGVTYGIIPIGPPGSLVNGARLAKALASEAQMEEIASGTAAVIAGGETRRVLRDSQRLASQYGGAAADWVKIGSSNYKPPASGYIGPEGGPGFEIHAYQNLRTGQIVELKTKFQ